MNIAVRRTAVIAAFLVGATYATWKGSRLLVAQSLAPQALSVTYVQTETREQDGAVVAKSERRLAVRSDGSKVEPRSVAAEDGRFYEQKIILDAKAGKRVVVESVTQSVVTTTLSDRELVALRSPGGRCLEQGLTPGGAILGYQTLQSEIRSPGLHVTSWWAQDIGCVLLRETISRPQPDGTSRLLFTREAAKITFGEPDAILFEAPNWPESTPSQVFERYRLRFNLPETDDLMKVKASKDQAYWAQQQGRP